MTEIRIALLLSSIKIVKKARPDRAFRAGHPNLLQPALLTVKTPVVRRPVLF
jgi:hypothetical protein